MTAGRGLDGAWGKAKWYALGGLCIAVPLFLLRARLGLGDDDARIAAFAAFGLGLVPLGLSIVERALRSRAVLDIHGIKIDLSQGAAVHTHEVTANVGLPDHARAGIYVNESSTASIANALSDLKHGEILLVDIGAGEEWWVTRLLALCAGAVRHAQTVLVFKGRCEATDDAFLGWCRPAEALDAILVKEPSYGEALRAAKQASFLLDLSRGPIHPFQGDNPSKLQDFVGSLWFRNNSQFNDPFTKPAETGVLSTLKGLGANPTALSHRAG